MAVSYIWQPKKNMASYEKQSKTYSFRLKNNLDPKIEEWLELQDNVSESIIAIISDWIARNGVTKLKIAPTVVSTTTAAPIKRIEKNTEKTDELKGEDKKTNKTDIYIKEQNISSQSQELLGEKEIQSFSDGDLDSLFN